jgi:hypothetical protein
MRYAFITICLFFALNAIGQNKKVLKKVEAELIEEKSQWYIGNIQLWIDNSSISGLVQFNDKMQTLKFKMEEGQPESLTPEEVRKFEFFDTKKQTLRSFISVDYPVVNTLIGKEKVQQYSITHDRLGKILNQNF